MWFLEGNFWVKKDHTLRKCGQSFYFLSPRNSVSPSFSLSISETTTDAMTRDMVPKMEALTHRMVEVEAALEGLKAMPAALAQVAELKQPLIDTHERVQPMRALSIP